MILLKNALFTTYLWCNNTKFFIMRYKLTYIQMINAVNSFTDFKFITHVLHYCNACWVVLSADFPQTVSCYTFPLSCEQSASDIVGKYLPLHIPNLFSHLDQSYNKGISCTVVPVLTNFVEIFQHYLKHGGPDTIFATFEFSPNCPYVYMRFCKFLFRSEYLTYDV